MGRIFDVQRFSLHDGPGIRTTVFFQGCPLRCRWCHNPEGVGRASILAFAPQDCVGCGECRRVCPQQAHRLENGVHVLDRSRCGACGRCAAECPAAALEMVGRDAPVDEILAEVLRDRAFYETSGGGMTLSGGEPLAQADFAAALLEGAKAYKLHCCLETSGAVAYSCLERVRPLVDLFLYDIKDTDSVRHRELTGLPNEGILGNLQQLLERGARVLLRLPLVPGLNAREDHFQGLAALVRRLPPVAGVQVMPYHRLAAGKLKRLGLDSSCTLDVPAPEAATVEYWRGRLSALGVPGVV